MNGARTLHVGRVGFSKGEAPPRVFCKCCFGKSTFGIPRPTQGDADMERFTPLFRDAVDGRNPFRTSLKPWEASVCWNLQGNRIIPGCLRCRIVSVHSSLAKSCVPMPTRRNFAAHLPSPSPCRAPDSRIMRSLSSCVREKRASCIVCCQVCQLLPVLPVAANFSSFASCCQFLPAG